MFAQQRNKVYCQRYRDKVKLDSSQEEKDLVNDKRRKSYEKAQLSLTLEDKENRSMKRDIWLKKKFECMTEEEKLESRKVNIWLHIVYEERTIWRD